MSDGLFPRAKLNWRNFVRGLPLLLGLVFIPTAVIIAVLEPDPAIITVIEAVFPVLVGGIIVGYGVWLFRSGFSPNRIKSISGFLLAGTFSVASRKRGFYSSAP